MLWTILQLPDWIQDTYKGIYGATAKSDVLTFLKCELVHAIWCLLLNEDFINAYIFGMIVLCADGIERHLFPQLFTYSADYPEKYIFCYTLYSSLYIHYRIILSTIKFLGHCLCPLCTCVKGKVQDLGTRADDLCRSGVQVDSEKQQNMVERT